MSMAAAHEYGSKRFGAHFGALLNLSLSFIFFELLQVDGSSSTDLWYIQQSLPSAQPFPLFPSPHFPICMMLVCSGATMKRDESLECFNQ